MSWHSCHEVVLILGAELFRFKRLITSFFFVNLGKSILGRRKKAKDSDDEESDDDEDEEDENADNEESDAATVDNSKKANPEKENDDSDDSTSKSSSKTGKDFEMVEKSTVDTADEEQDQP